MVGAVQMTLPTSVEHDKLKSAVNPPCEMRVTVKFCPAPVASVADVGVTDPWTLPTVTSTVAVCTREPICPCTVMVELPVLAFRVTTLTCYLDPTPRLEPDNWQPTEGFDDVQVRAIACALLVIDEELKKNEVVAVASVARVDGVAVNEKSTT